MTAQEADAYLTGFVDGTLIALGLDGHSPDGISTAEIKARISTAKKAPRDA